MRRTPALSPLHASAWLAVVFIAAKALTWNDAWLPDPHLRFVELLMSSWSDVAFALACGFMGKGLACGLGRVGRIAFLVVAALCAAYAMAAVGLFGYFNRPLTFQMLTLVGNAEAVRSSITQRLTTGTALGLILAPVLFLVLAVLFRRTTRLLAVLSVWAIAGCVLQRTFWREDRLTEVWRSPHFELLRTGLIHVAGGQRPSFPRDFPPEYVNEFRTFGARGASANFFQPADAGARPRNVIVVVLESVGTKYLRLYGSPLDVMPHLEAEARYALVFDNIYAHASFTYAAFRTLTFGVYAGLPWHYALIDNARPFPGTLAGALRARGARTAFISNGVIHWEDLSWLIQRSGAFERMDDYGTIGCPPLTSWGTEDRCVVDRLLSWIDEKPDAPFFAICWTDQTHDPYQLGPGVTPMDFFAGQAQPPFAKDLNAYLNVMRETDRHLGRMFAALRERGLGDDTLVVVTGDHGEAFADPHQQRGHAWSVYEEEVRVPLMFWNPRLFPNGGRVPTIGGHVDLNPTIVDLLGMEPDREWQGHSLFDPAKPSRASFMAIAGGDVFGVREGDWKYIYDVTSGRESLFNLGSDRDEQRDLSTAEPQRAADLRKRVAAWVTFEDAFLWGREN